MKSSRRIDSLTLIKLGLSPNEANSYVVLSQEGSLSAKELAKHLGILPNATYQLLQKLVNKGLISVYGKYPAVYRTLSPSVAFDAFSKRKILEIEELKEKAVKELTVQKPKTEETQINIIPSKFEIFATYNQMLGRTKKESLIISIGESISEETILAMRDALERGVEIRLIVHKYDEENKNLLSAWKKMGIKIRHKPDWGFHLMVFDGQKSILAVNNPKDTRERIGIQIFSQGLAKAHRDYFYSVWKMAKEI